MFSVIFLRLKLFYTALEGMRPYSYTRATSDCTRRQRRGPMQNDKNVIAQLTPEQNTLFNAMFGMQS